MVQSCSNHFQPTIFSQVRYCCRAAGGQQGLWAKGRPDRSRLADPQAVHCYQGEYIYMHNIYIYIYIYIHMGYYYI